MPAEEKKKDRDSEKGKKKKHHSYPIFLHREAGEGGYLDIRERKNILLARQEQKRAAAISSGRVAERISH